MNDAATAVRTGARTSASEPASNQPAGVTVARILRPRGRRGEVAAELLTDFPERLTRRAEVWLCDAEKGLPPRPVAVRNCWLHKGQAVFHFEGCQSIADAEKLVGLQVQIPLAERAPLPHGSYFLTDLIGCEVWEAKEAEEAEERKQGKEKASATVSFSSFPFSPSCTTLLGVVWDVQFTGEVVAGTPLLVVGAPDGELLIPLAEEICVRIDPASRRIEVALPDGLRDMNRR